MSEQQSSNCSALCVAAATAQRHEAARFYTVRGRQQQYFCGSIFQAPWVSDGTNDPLVHCQVRNNRQIQGGGRNNENVEAKQVFT
jgi:hypothetical protein